MNFDPLSFVLGNHGDFGPVRDVISYLIGRVAGTAGEIWQTLTNVAVASFTAVAATLRDLVIDVTPVQAAGTPTPSAPLPISGWTGAQIATTSKNPGATYIFGKANINGIGVIAVPQGDLRVWKLPVIQGRSYHIVSASSSAIYYAFYGHEPKIGSVAYDNTRYEGSADFTVTAPITGWLAFRSDLDFDDVAYTVTWSDDAGTVYGGSLTDNGDGTWMLTVTHGRAQVKDFGWTRAQVSGASFYRFWVYLDGKAAGLGNIICEALQMSDAAAVADMSDNSIRGADASNTVSIRADAFSTVEDLTDTTTGIGNAAIVYELATPVSYPITADSVQALIGSNNIFADTGNINTITFRTH